MDGDELRGSVESAAAELQETGVVLLRGVFALDWLRRMRKAAERCFASAESGGSYSVLPLAPSVLPPAPSVLLPAPSVLLPALLDFGVRDAEELMAPLAAPGIAGLLSAALGSAWMCDLRHSWVRKKFAPGQAPASHLQGWHQDGALGVRFPREAGQIVPMTGLITCWIPLTPCATDRPGLEFVRRPQAGLLHFTELEDAALRRRFAAEAFWAPELELGDGLVFLNSVLHRTYVRPKMENSRLSVEYRVFPTKE